MTDPEENIVSVCCSEFGIISFAMQYGGYVEILDPIPLREEVAERAKKLYEKYL